MVAVTPLRAGSCRAACQYPRRRLESRRADVAELVDAHGSGPCARKGVEVQVLSSALPFSGDPPATMAGTSRPPLRRRKAGEAGRGRVLDASAVAELSF